MVVNKWGGRKYAQAQKYCMMQVWSNIKPHGFVCIQIFGVELDITMLYVCTLLNPFIIIFSWKIRFYCRIWKNYKFFREKKNDNKINWVNPFRESLKFSNIEQFCSFFYFCYCRGLQSFLLFISLPLMPTQRFNFVILFEIENVKLTRNEERLFRLIYLIYMLGQRFHTVTIDHVSTVLQENRGKHILLSLRWSYRMNSAICSQTSQAISKQIPNQL